MFLELTDVEDLVACVTEKSKRASIANAAKKITSKEKNMNTDTAVALLRSLQNSSNKNMENKPLSSITTTNINTNNDYMISSQQANNNNNLHIQMHPTSTDKVNLDKSKLKVVAKSKDDIEATNILSNLSISAMKIHTGNFIMNIYIFIFKLLETTIYNNNL